ncbi:hypothetical protein SDC9_209046 [bioreactor metagenome]|uniref:Uncharacterized protein n=1 Tax=bioreactor metagenome TaxID=1076179 RepID=A0A645JCC5_9ZZZZ|nr:hypothetical protein [Paludibacter sp.]
METMFNPQEVGKGIADFGFVIVAAAAYMIYSATMFILFIKWFMRIVNGIIDRQQQVLQEIVTLQKQQQELLESIDHKLKKVA